VLLLLIGATLESPFAARIEIFHERRRRFPAGISRFFSAGEGAAGDLA
jgi:hypothetical protein